MAQQPASLKVVPPTLAEAFRLVLPLATQTEGQIAEQREMDTQLENAADPAGSG
ncbi:MAG: hypothetical protein JO331_03120 [Verrucomicrobia bacterium]|nr:hypothetical protein [Verrucomicrobiota bacterium]